jgi:magnesium transporter
MLGHLLKPEIQELVGRRDLAGLRDTVADWEPVEIAELVDDLPEDARAVVFRLLPRRTATQVFEHLSPDTQRSLVEALAREPLAGILNDMSPDDRTALLEELPAEVTRRLLELLTPAERRTTSRLLGYPEESIGRLMTPEYVWLYPEWTVWRALQQVRERGRDSETLDVLYVIDHDGRLLDDLRIRELLLADPEATVESLADGRFVALAAADDQETAIETFRAYDRTALPVTDSQGVLIGIVTVDDALDVAAEEATEDIQKIGGSAALEEPYLRAPFGELVRKRAPWLVVLLGGQMLTASAMGIFEHEIGTAVVLALFVPMILSSGGNAGSQAVTFIVRSMALGEVDLRDWWRVMRREMAAGVALGVMLASFGIARIALWESAFGSYGAYWGRLALTIGVSLVAVVLWGTFAGGMLPFLLRRLGVDPAASSAPLVSTLSDVAGILIYFGVATFVLRGALL